jgi:hypothetical protein
VPVPALRSSPFFGNIPHFLNGLKVDWLLFIQVLDNIPFIAKKGACPRSSCPRSSPFFGNIPHFLNGLKGDWLLFIQTLDNIPFISEKRCLSPVFGDRHLFRNHRRNAPKQLTKKEPVPYFSKPEAHRHVKNG